MGKLENYLYLLLTADTLIKLFKCGTKVTTIRVHEQIKNPFNAQC